MLRGRNLGLELVRFAVSAETSSELEAFHSKHSALMNFQQPELKPSSPKQGTTPSSDPLANGLWRLSIRITHLDPGWHNFLKEQCVKFQGGQDLTSQITFVGPQQDLTLLAHVTQGCPTLPVTELFGKIYHHLSLQTGLLFQSLLNRKSLPICVSFIFISSAQIWRRPAYKYLLIGCLENLCFL